ncbi:MAG: hypothetical protein Q9213_000864 [Squamulea squamosa]
MIIEVTKGKATITSQVSPIGSSHDRLHTLVETFSQRLPTKFLAYFFGYFDQIIIRTYLDVIDMPKRLTVAASQSYTLPTTSATLSALTSTAKEAARQGVHLLLFPEAYLGGYPRHCNFGATVGSRSEDGREQFLQYFHSAIDLGDTPRGAGDDWVERKLEVAKGQKWRGDGTRENLETVAKETGIFLVVGLVERAGGSLYCGVVYVCPREGCIGKRRKVMPVRKSYLNTWSVLMYLPQTGAERLVWAQGSPSTLKAVTTTIRDVKLTLAVAICWENYMPLLRYSLYSQNVNLYLAPTADGRDTWLPLMRTIACESRAYVLSANQCMRRKHLPPWTCSSVSKKAESSSVSNGGAKLGDAPSATNAEEPQEYKIPSSDQGATPKTPEPTPVDKLHGVVSPSPLHIGTSSSDIQSESPAKHRNGRRRSSNLMPIPDNHFLALPGDSAVDESEEEQNIKSNAPADDGNDFVSRGGSCIIDPAGYVLQGPLWEVEEGGLLIARDIDFEDCERRRLDIDVAGSYSRNDSFELKVAGLDLNPPP